jgi:hypothetical protein
VRVCYTGFWQLIFILRKFPSNYVQDFLSKRLHDISSRNSPPSPADPIEWVVYLRTIFSPEEASRIYDISVLGKRLPRKSDNVLVLPFAFHIAVQQPFKPLWSRLLLYELEPSRASLALCFKALLMTLLPASVLVSHFVWRQHFELSSKGGPTSSYATAGIALRVTGVLKTAHHDKVEPPTRRTGLPLTHKFCLVTCIVVLAGNKYTEFSEKPAVSIFIIEMKFVYHRNIGKIWYFSKRSLFE